jgi:hypothetical protein
MNPNGDGIWPLSLASVDWIPILVAMFQSIRRFFKQPAHIGPYEIPEYESVLEITTARGSSAVFKKRERVKRQALGRLSS